MYANYDNGLLYLQVLFDNDDKGMRQENDAVQESVLSVFPYTLLLLSWQCKIHTPSTSTQKKTL